MWQKSEVYCAPTRESIIAKIKEAKFDLHCQRVVVGDEAEVSLTYCVGCDISIVSVELGDIVELCGPPITRLSRTFNNNEHRKNQTIRFRIKAKQAGECKIAVRATVDKINLATFLLTCVAKSKHFSY